MFGHFEDITPDELRRTLEINTLGVANGCWAALQHLKVNGGGLIIVSSLMGQVPLALMSSYCASKHATVGLVDCLRMELKQTYPNVTVTNILPGPIDTPGYDVCKSKLPSGMYLHEISTVFFVLMPF